MVDHIQKRLKGFQQQSRMNAGSLIISVFGDAVLPRGGRIGLGSLIQLLTPLGVSDRLIRTSIFRLVKEEWMYSEAIGRRADYMLTPAGLRRFEESARQIYAAESPAWDHRWRLILSVGELDTKQRERLKRALFWQGFGAIGTDCFVHPSADLVTVMDALTTEGMGDLLKHLMPLTSEMSDTEKKESETDTDLVKRAWNLGQLGSAYAQFVKQYQPMLKQLQSANTHASDESQFLLRTLLIHDYRRLLLRDPELPKVLLPQDWSGQEARHLCQALYGQLLTPSERHITQHMKLADGSAPKARPMLASRFQVRPIA